MTSPGTIVVDVHAHVHDPELIQRREAFAARDPWFAIQNPPGSRRLSSPARLLRAMDAHGVGQAWAVGFGWRDHGMCTARNDAISAMRLRMDPVDAARLRWFGTVNPAAGASAIAEVDRLADLGFTGVGELFPDGQGFDPGDRATMGPFLEACAARGLAVVVHASDPVGPDFPGRDSTGPAKALALVDVAAAAAPDVELIIAHLGGGLPFYASMPDVRRRIERTRVAFDTAACVLLHHPSVLQAATRHLPGRVRLGSDHPVAGVAAAVAWVRDAGLDPDAEAAILTGVSSTGRSPGSTGVTS